MEKDCLYEKCKKVVENDNLSTLGTVVFNVKAKLTVTEQQQRFRFNLINYSDSSIKIEVTNGGGFAETLEDLESNPKTSETYSRSYYPRTLYFKNADYNVIITPKYYFDIILFADYQENIFSFNPTEFQYTKNLKTFSLIGIRISEIVDISFIKEMQQLKEFHIDGYNTIGDLSSIAHLSSFERFNVYNCKVTGDIANLGRNINCFVCNLRGSKIYGSINDLANLLLLNGKGEISSYNYITITGNGIITYKDENDEDVIIPNNTTKNITFANGSYSIS